MRRSELNWDGLPNGARCDVKLTFDVRLEALLNPASEEKRRLILIGRDGPYIFTGK